MVKPEQNDLVRGDDGLFHLSPQGTARVGETLPADDNVKVLAGVLEGSNVNPAGSHGRYDCQCPPFRNANEGDPQCR